MSAKLRMYLDPAFNEEVELRAGTGYWRGSKLYYHADQGQYFAEYEALEQEPNGELRRFISHCTLLGFPPSRVGLERGIIALPNSVQGQVEFLSGDGLGTMRLFLKGPNPTLVLDTYRAILLGRIGTTVPYAR